MYTNLLKIDFYQNLIAIFIIKSISAIDFSSFASNGNTAIGTTPDPLIPSNLHVRIILKRDSRSSFVFRRVIPTVDGLIICATFHLEHMYLNSLMKHDTKSFLPFKASSLPINHTKT